MYLPNRFEAQCSFRQRAFLQPHFSCLKRRRVIYLRRLRFSSTSRAAFSSFSSFCTTGSSAFSSPAISASFLRISIGASFAALRSDFSILAEAVATGYEDESCCSPDFSLLGSETYSSSFISESSSELGSWFGCDFCSSCDFFCSSSDFLFFG